MMNELLFTLILKICGKTRKMGYKIHDFMFAADIKNLIQENSARVIPRLSWTLPIFMLRRSIWNWLYLR